jgi:transcriptional regulator with XRE-family HTH domain
MENFGQAIGRRRRELGLTQRKVAERVRFEDGHAISGVYLVELEHNTRRPPRAFLIEQFARAEPQSRRVVLRGWPTPR